MSELKDYTLTFAAGAPATQKLYVQGNFFYVKKGYSVVTLTDRLVNQDVRVKITFDDEGSIVVRPREGGKRKYQSVNVSLVNVYGTGVVTPTVETKLELVLGEGELYSQRDNGATPDIMATVTHTVPAGNSNTIALTNLLPGVDDATPQEVRINIPLGAASGLFFSGYASGGTGIYAWLDVGTSEWLTYSGPIYFRNASGGSIDVNIAVIYRKD